MFGCFAALLPLFFELFVCFVEPGMGYYYVTTEFLECDLKLGLNNSNNNKIIFIALYTKVRIKALHNKRRK